MGNYIRSQQPYYKFRNDNPLRYTATLKSILLSRKLLLTRKVGVLEVREKFESLLTEINGPWNAMQRTLSVIPITDGRLLQVANARLITFRNEWNPPLTSNVTMLAPNSAQGTLFKQ
jgi:hypothetical protein